MDAYISNANNIKFGKKLLILSHMTYYRCCICIYCNAIHGDMKPQFYWIEGKNVYTLCSWCSLTEQVLTAFNLDNLLKIECRKSGCLVVLDSINVAVIVNHYAIKWNLINVYQNNRMTISVSFNDQVTIQQPNVAVLHTSIRGFEEFICAFQAMFTSNYSFVLLIIYWCSKVSMFKLQFFRPVPIY